MAQELRKGTVVKSLRGIRGWERSRLAEVAGIPDERLAAYERGEGEPSESEMERLGEALGLRSWEERGLAQEVLQQIAGLLVAEDESEKRRAAERVARLLLALDRVQREPKQERTS